MVASKVGLPLEVDKENLHKNDYVRVKIGCRDVTKVPASVDGVLDFNFYDYFFQREVPQDGFTNPSGNKWIRNERDKSKDEFPSPKKQRMEPTKDLGQPSVAGTSKSASNVKGKQVSVDCSGQKKTQALGNNDEDSEDEGLRMGDLIIPESDQLRFGTFENLEIRMLSNIFVNESSHTVINEYGSNLQKSKHDPLTAIALHACKKFEFFQLEDYMIKPGPSKSLPSILEEKKENHNTTRAVSMSPTKGSQGAPEIDYPVKKKYTTWGVRT
jgi:hypothetical protein